MPNKYQVGLCTPSLTLEVDISNVMMEWSSTPWRGSDGGGTKGPVSGCQWRYLVWSLYVGCGSRRSDGTRSGHWIWQCVAAKMVLLLGSVD